MPMFEQTKTRGASGWAVHKNYLVQLQRDWSYCKHILEANFIGFLAPIFSATLNACPKQLRRRYKNVSYSFKTGSDCFSISAIVSAAITRVAQTERNQTDFDRFVRTAAPE